MNILLYPFPEKVLKLESLVEVCSSCGAWVERYPEYLGEDDNFWQCDRCMCTSTTIRQGRPYGPKSKEWSHLMEQLEELWPHMTPYDFRGIVTDPPLPDPWEGSDTAIVILD